MEQQKPLPPAAVEEPARVQPQRRARPWHFAAWASALGLAGLLGTAVLAPSPAKLVLEVQPDVPFTLEVARAGTPQNVSGLTRADLLTLPPGDYSVNVVPYSADYEPQPLTVHLTRGQVLTLPVSLIHVPVQHEDVAPAVEQVAGPPAETVADEVPPADDAVAPAEEPDRLMVFVGERQQLHVPGVSRVMLGDTDILDVTALDPEELQLKGVGAGMTTLAVWTHDGKRMAWAIEVTPKRRLPAKLQISPGELVSRPDTTHTRIVSTAPDVATVELVDGKMLLRAVDVGKTKIVATSASGVKETMTVTVEY